MMDARDRPVEAEVEVTPEMIEAGLTAFFDCDVHTEEMSDVVKAIYLAMQVAQQSAKAAL